MPLRYRMWKVVRHWFGDELNELLEGTYNNGLCDGLEAAAYIAEKAGPENYEKMTGQERGVSEAEAFVATKIREYAETI